jgi:hypothetical protein
MYVDLSFFLFCCIGDKIARKLCCAVANMPPPFLEEVARVRKYANLVLFPDIISFYTMFR